MKSMPDQIIKFWNPLPSSFKPGPKIEYQKMRSHFFKKKVTLCFEKEHSYILSFHDIYESRPISMIK